MHIVCRLKSALSLCDNYAQALKYSRCELELSGRAAPHRVFAERFKQDTSLDKEVNRLNDPTSGHSGDFYDL